MYANAYILLDSEREYHSDIPWSAYVRYGEYYEFTRDQTDWLIEIGRRVDKVILADRAKERGNTKATSRPSK